MSMDLKTSHTMKIATGKFLNPNHHHQVAEVALV